MLITQIYDSCGVRDTGFALWKVERGMLDEFVVQASACGIRVSDKKL